MEFYNRFRRIHYHPFRPRDISESQRRPSAIRLGDSLAGKVDKR